MQNFKVLKACALATTLLGGTALVAPSTLLQTAEAQDYTSGGLTVTVTDEAGAPVSNASVVVTSNARGETRSSSTGANGETFFGRLAIGSYSVSVEAAGYGAVVDNSVPISVGDISDFGVVVAATAVGEDDTLRQDAVVVVGSRNVGSSFSVAETGLTIDVDEITSKIPVARNINAIAQLTPGAVVGDSAFGAGTSISGSSVGENVFYINGMNITDFRNFIGASTIPFSFYDQVEVKSGGYQAEFGRNTGGVINAVTKSGTNEWHGGVNYFIELDELREQSPNTYLARNEFDQRRRESADFWLSGPLIKDRLFGYALFNPRDNETVNISEGGTKNTDTLDDPFWAVKLDAVIADGHTLEYTGFSDKRETVRTQSDVTFNADGSIQSDTESGKIFFGSGGRVDIAKYTGSFTDWFTLSALYGQQSFDQTTSGTLDNEILIIDAIPAASVVTSGVAALVSSGEDERELIRVDADFRAEAFGSHQIRVGFDQETLNASDISSYPGGIYYRFEDEATCVSNGGPSGDTCVRVRVFEGGGEFETEQTAIYIQDAWQVTDKLLLNLGLRNETFNNKNANGETFTKIEDQLSPRVSAFYDIHGDGSTEVFASYGRYYLPVATNTNIRLAGAELFTQDWYSYTGADTSVAPTLVGAAFTSAVFGDGTVPDTRSVVDPDLEPMYKDEIILGVNHDFTDRLSMTATYTYRSLEQTLEDIAVDAAVLAYCDANGIAGCDSIWTGFHSYVLANPGSDVTFVTDELPGTTDFTSISLSAADLGYPEAKNTYKALEVSGTYNGDNYFLSGSYTLSESKGNYEGPVRSDNGQDDAGITTNFDQPGLTDGTNGLLPNHRAHKLKIWGNYEFTDSFRMGGRLDVSSPRKFGCIGVHPTDGFAALYGDASFYCDLNNDGTNELTPRGTVDESDWITTVDFNASYDLGTIGFGNATLSLDVFNLFDESGVTDIEEDDVADFGSPTGYQTPRTVRLGVQYEF